jgi:hypothetical protein
MSDAVKNLASLAHLLSNEGLDEHDDFVLLTAWETRNLFEDLLHATDRTVAAFRDNIRGQQLLDGDPENLGQLGQNVRAWRLFAQLPVGDVWLGFAD